MFFVFLFHFLFTTIDGSYRENCEKFLQNFKWKHILLSSIAGIYIFPFKWMKLLSEMALSTLVFFTKKKTFLFLQQNIASSSSDTKWKFFSFYVFIYFPPSRCRWLKCFHPKKIAWKSLCTYTELFHFTELYSFQFTFYKQKFSLFFLRRSRRNFFLPILNVSCHCLHSLSWMKTQFAYEENLINDIKPTNE